MLSETKAVKRAVAELKKRKGRLRSCSYGIDGKSKKRRRGASGRSVNIGFVGVQIMRDGELDWRRWGWGYGSRSLHKRMAKRIAKKLGQPFRRQPRRRRRAAGKNEVTRRFT